MTLLQWLSASITVVSITFATSASGESGKGQAPPRLLFAQNYNDECRIGYWYKAVGEPVILTRTDTCPDRLFVDKPANRVLFVDGRTLQWMEVTPEPETHRVSLPDPEFSVWRDQMSLKPENRKHFNPTEATMSPKGARFSDDGPLSVLMELVMPTDDTYEYFFKREGENWAIRDSRHCHRMGCNFGKEKGSETGTFQDFVSTSVWDNDVWPASRAAWNEDLGENEYITYRKENPGDRSPGLSLPSSVEIGIKANNRSSVLRARINVSDHGTISTDRVSLRAGSEKEKVMAKAQSFTSIVGHHMLLNETLGPFYLIDLSTGETVLVNLGTAAWID